MKKGVLIVCPHLHVGGGVSGYYNSLKKFFPPEVGFFFVGARHASEALCKKPLNLMRDLFRLISYLARKGSDYAIIHINPSFLPASLVRDGLILRISKLFGKKCIVFFRGWNDEYASRVSDNHYSLFFSTYNRADRFIVLSSEFKDKLRLLGFRQTVHVETTAVDEELIDGFTLEQKRGGLPSGSGRAGILFLSRIEREKGIIETIDAVKILSDSYPNVRLSVAGTGTFLDEAKRYARDIGMSHRVAFHGHLSGRSKREAFEASDIFVFPTYHGEGMPNSILEAMAFGIPVITRPVGGIKDFFVNGRFGYLTRSTEPAVIASLIERTVLDRERYVYMSGECHQYAKERFLAGSVAKRLSGIYDETLRGT